MIRSAERMCVLLLLVYLIWVPMPFGSNVGWAYPALVLPPILLCAAAAMLRIRHARGFQMLRAYRVWTAGAIALVIIAGIQLVPLPPAVLGSISPESSSIWAGADRIASLTRGAAPVPMDHPITVDPNATWLELFRGLALFATFQAAALLIYSNTRRLAFAGVLAATAMFEVLYGVREAALKRYAIWGWVNTLMYDRVTGTYVNPNHFAHYLAIVLPLAAYVGAIAWHLSGSRVQAMPWRRRLAQLLERHLLLASLSAATCVACVAGILVAQSRGALAAVAAGIAIVVAILSTRIDRAVASRRRRAARVARRVAFASVAFLALVGALVVFLGRERTVTRFRASEQEQTTLVGRRVGIEAAARLWQLFPWFGSGAGTFANVVSITQTEDLAKLYEHAHDDYAELAATMGGIGFVIGAASFFAGLVLAFRRYLNFDAPMSWRGRAFGVAALSSVTIAALHAFVDFNFFIPANAVTMAAICGAAAAARLITASQAAEAGENAPEA